MRTLPKAPKRLFLEIGMLAFWVPSFWEILENVSPQNTSVEKLSAIGQHQHLSEDPGLTTYFFPGRDGVGGGWGYPGESSSST